MLEKTSESTNEIDDYYSQKNEEVESEEISSLVDTEGKIVGNDLKKQFMTFLQAKDDNLLMQTSGCLLTLVTQSKVS